MNTSLKTTLALGAAGLSLLALAGGASAQTTVGDASLTNVYSTLNAGRNPVFTGGSVGVGNDPSGNISPSALTPATSQSVYDAFTFDSSAAGAFSTVAAGTTAQIEIYGLNHSATQAPTFDVYASLYAYNPNDLSANTGIGPIPVTGPNLFGSEQKVTLGASTGGFFSADFSLAGGLVAGQTYVLGITTLTGTPQDYANIAVSPFSADGLSAADNQLSKIKYTTNTNDQGSGASVTGGVPLTSNNVIAFKLDTAPTSAPVPEGSMSLDFVLGLGVLGVAVGVTKRRRSIAK